MARKSWDIWHKPIEPDGFLNFFRNSSLNQKRFCFVAAFCS